MAKRIDKTAIKKRAVKMNDAWKEGAVSVEFMGVKQADLNGKITAIETKEQTLDDLRAQIKMLEEEILDDYAELDDTLVDVGNGAAPRGGNSPSRTTLQVLAEPLATAQREGRESDSPFASPAPP